MSQTLRWPLRRLLTQVVENDVDKLGDHELAPFLREGKLQR